MCLCPNVLANEQPASPTAEFVCRKVLIDVHNSCIAAAHEWRLQFEISPVDCLRTRLSSVSSKLRNGISQTPDNP